MIEQRMKSENEMKKKKGKLEKERQRGKKERSDNKIRRKIFSKKEFRFS